MSRSPSSIEPSSTVVGAEHVRRDAASLARVWHRCAEERASGRPGRAAGLGPGDRGDRASLSRDARAAGRCAAPAPATPAARCRRRAASSSASSGSTASSRSTRRTCSPSCEPAVDHRRPAGGGRSARAVLSAGSAKPEGVVTRRQRRRVRRRSARVQVRRHQALRAGARGRAADRRDHPHGRRRR